MFCCAFLLSARLPPEVYLLAEDDFIPVQDFKTKLPTVLQHLPPDWDTVPLRGGEKCPGVRAVHTDIGSCCLSICYGHLLAVLVVLR